MFQITVGTGAVSRGLNGRGVALITYLHLAPRMSMSKAIHLLPRVSHGLLRGDLYLYLFQGLFQHLYRDSSTLFSSAHSELDARYKSNNRHYLFDMLFMIYEFVCLHSVSGFRASGRFMLRRWVSDILKRHVAFSFYEP